MEEMEARRKRAGLTQKRLCEEAGVDASTYSQIKLGRRGAYQRTIERLSEALDRLIATQERAA